MKKTKCKRQGLGPNQRVKKDKDHEVVGDRNCK